MKVVVFNLGCKVNQYESDVLIKEFEERGYEVSSELGYADYYILNTCAVTAEAERKSRQAVTRAKRYNPNAKIFICGCASEKDAKQFSEKDGVVTVKGIGGKYSLVELIEQGEAVDIIPSIFEDGIAKSTRTRSYIKVQDGCNNFCSYCIIPYLRGRSRSRSLESIKAEILKLNNVKEIVLTGIDLSSYGLDIDSSLTELINSLTDINIRIRLGSLEVRVVDRPLLEALTKLKAFCPQFHLSLQNGDDTVLKSMNRHYTCDEYYSKVCLIREYFPLASITTDIIVGFPTETDEAFSNTLAFVNKVKFSNTHIFPYSAREGTQAYKKYKALPKEVISLREKQLNELKERLKLEYEQSFINQNVEVLIEDIENEYMVGYTREYIKVYTNKQVGHNEVVELKATNVFMDGLKGE